MKIIYFPFQEHVGFILLGTFYITAPTNGRLFFTCFESRRVMIIKYKELEEILGYYTNISNTGE